MPDDVRRPSEGEVDGAVAPSEGGAKSSPLEKISPAAAVHKLLDEVRDGRLDAELLLDTITGSDDEELFLQLTSLAGQLGYSWEITE